VTSPGPPPGESPCYLLTLREAFVLRQARVVAPPPITRAEWSSDGNYVLAVREEKPPPLPIAGPPTGELGLMVWNRRTGRTQEIWKRPARPQRVEQLGWLPGTHVALRVVVSVHSNAPKPASQRTLFRVDPLHRRVVRLRALSGEKLQISPRQPLAALVDWRREGRPATPHVIPFPCKRGNLA